MFIEGLWMAFACFVAGLIAWGNHKQRRALLDDLTAHHAAMAALLKARAEAQDAQSSTE